MAKSVMRTMLVIGEDHSDIVKKYSLDTKVKEYVRYKREDAQKLQKKHIDLLESLLSSSEIKLTVNQRETYKELYQELKDMDEFDYYLYLTDGCKYDEETGDALSTENPNAHYTSEKFYQDRLINNNEEGYISTPFTLKDGSKSYIAKKGDIDWSYMHYNPNAVKLYQCAWELIVDFNYSDKTIEDNAINEWIKTVANKYGIAENTVNNIWNNMNNRMDYFNCFKDMDEYVAHSVSFWTYSIASADNYEEVSFKISDKQWVKDYFDKYIKPLSDDTTLSIYEIRLLDN